MALDFNEQIKLLRAAQGRGMRPSQASQKEIDSILEGARLVVGARQPGQSVDETIVSLARQIVEEDNQRVKRDPKLRARRVVILKGCLQPNSWAWMKLI